MRDEWKAKRNVTWSDGVFDALERFVDSKAPKNRQKFADTGDINDLFEGEQLPSPPPSPAHQEYMREYARR